MHSGDGELRPPELGSQPVSFAPPQPGSIGTELVENEPVNDRAARRTRLRRRLAATGVSLWSLGLLGAGVAIGYRLSEPAPIPPEEVVIEVDPVALDALEPGGEVVTVMPAVLGLSEADARAVLADGGFDSSDITVAEVPRAGDADLVAEQQPAAGTESPTSITLFVSIAAEMPDLVGATRAEAEAAVRELGARPAFARAYQPGAAPDTVLTSSPSAGESVPELVTITLASRPASVFLSDLRAVDSDCSRGEAKANGVESEHSILCSLPRLEASASVSWDLSRRADRFTAQLGIGDDGAIDGVGRVQVVVDGVVVAEFDARFGSLADIDVPVTGVLRLELRFTTLVAPTTGSARVVLIDAALLGAEASINELAGLS